MWSCFHYLVSIVEQDEVVAAGGGSGGGRAGAFRGPACEGEETHV